MIVTLRSLESVHRLSYFLFCNVLHIWTIRAIPTYRVYRLYDITDVSKNSILLQSCFKPNIFSEKDDFKNSFLDLLQYLHL